ncbi:TIM23 complex component [Onygenales sp. PD_10]|nr:TIM23 complex component [Onygenales sp. PD_10]
MHLTVMNTPLRSAILGSRGISCGLSPFVFSSSANTPNPSPSLPAVHQQCKYQRFQQKRHASTTRASQSLFKIQPLASSTTPCSAQATRTTSALIPATALRTAPSSLREASTQAGSSPNQNAQLDWNSFFRLRRSRRRFSLITSIIGSVGFTMGGVQRLSMHNLDATIAQMLGLDPLITLGLGTAACAALGWLLGPVVGSAMWNLRHWKHKESFAIKEKEFYSRIKRFRVDPSVNSYSNPVPDYYGEKIGSIQGYRQWLKDQRAFNRKRRSFI